MHRPQFRQFMRSMGVEIQTLPVEGGRHYYDWEGGGIRYWSGHREIPRSRTASRARAFCPGEGQL